MKENFNRELEFTIKNKKNEYKGESLESDLSNLKIGEHKQYVETLFLKNRLVEKIRILRKDFLAFIELNDFVEFIPTFYKHRVFIKKYLKKIFY
jgi:hypothetical protein